MKNLIFALIASLVLFPAIAHAEYRAMHGVVISTLDGVAHILTEDGNEWMVDKEDFDTDDRVFLVLDDMNTPDNITDDVVRISWYDPD